MKPFWLILVIICLSITCRAQQNIGNQYDVALRVLNERGEVYFKFSRPGNSLLTTLGRHISIDKVSGDSVWAYASEKGFQKFIETGLHFNLLQAPGICPDVVIKDVVKSFQTKSNWDYYPTYQAYEAMMYQFETAYPNLCEIINIGMLPGGHKLLVARISDSLLVDEDEPQFLYTSTMHGDETAGYILMLRLIDYLLSNYGTNPEITYLVNNIDIYINPLANPDGTYFTSDSTVSGAKRFNTSNVDLNGNFPDPQFGQHPDGNAWQAETQAFMNFATSKNFVMSANFHGGAELVNYPWDTWPQLPADNTWWIHVSKEYADTAQYYSPTGYFDDLGTGYTNGYDWYQITGSRQDYMNYWHSCRESTIELSLVKLLNPSLLDAHWGYNYRNFLNYMKQCLYGVRGIVSDSLTGQPLEAEILITGHDKDNSSVYSALPIGNYHRFLPNGYYDITFSSPWHITRTINNVSVTNYTTTRLDVKLAHVSQSIDNQNNIIQNIKLFPNPVNNNFRVEFYNTTGSNVAIIRIFDIAGKCAGYFERNIQYGLNSLVFDTQLDKGMYILNVDLGGQQKNKKFVISKGLQGF